MTAFTRLVGAAVVALVLLAAVGGIVIVVGSVIHGGRP